MHAFVRRSWRPAARAAFWAALLFAVTMALVPRPPELPGSPSDKLQHVAAFAVLAWLGAAAWPALPLLRLGLGLAAVGLFIEIAQAVPALGREADPVDLAVDVAALVAALAPVAVYRRRARPPSRSTRS